MEPEWFKDPREATQVHRLRNASIFIATMPCCGSKVDQVSGSCSLPWYRKLLTRFCSGSGPSGVHFDHVLSTDAELRDRIKEVRRLP